MKPDLGVLRGPDTVYPVFIDPQVYTPKATAWTMASLYWASSPQWKFQGESDAGLGSHPVRSPSRIFSQVPSIDQRRDPPPAADLRPRRTPHRLPTPAPDRDRRDRPADLQGHLQAAGLSTESGQVEGTRAKPNRLAERGWLRKTATGSFTSMS
ncbi:hypothetical protein ACFPOI_33645 [Nonomuraea angiospora]|uniref:Uncharacterized protein n=1 Tax=Nonomuraea angiospora TaxID=46172 RepID=A0ABR9LT05_9ACTN|nr:hypothetical protein [Nonomuraea angiospora]MBE1583784.1 hypothetical protein [Nonomuraea angiospora]